MDRFNKYLHQRVNSYLCMTLLALMAFWMVLFYATHKATALADGYVASATTVKY